MREPRGDLRRIQGLRGRYRRNEATLLIAHFQKHRVQKRHWVQVHIIRHWKNWPSPWKKQFITSCPFYIIEAKAIFLSVIFIVFLLFLNYTAITSLPAKVGTNASVRAAFATVLFSATMRQTRGMNYAPNERKISVLFIFYAILFESCKYYFCKKNYQLVRWKNV